MARPARPSFLPLPALLLAAVLLPAPLPAPVLAQALCSEPVEPICATTIPATDPSAATDRGVATNRCLEDMESYRTKLADYRNCLAGTLATAERSQKAADEFVRCLQGGQPECRLERVD